MTETKPRSRRNPLDEILDFGPDEAPAATGTSNEVNRRLKRLLEQIQDISRRLDNLQTRE